MTTTLDLQRRLLELGLDPGPLDGEWGPRTRRAVIAFQRSVGLKPDGIVGPRTRLAMFPAVADKRLVRPAPPMPEWLRLAIAEIGMKEIAGKDSAGRIIEYRKLGKTTDDNTTEDGSRPWCADFVCAMLELAGVRSTRSGMARAIERSPHFVKLAGPALGAVVTMWRGARQSGLGHTNFYGGRYDDGPYAGVGGNQRDAVTVAPYGTSRVVGFYWPKSLPLPAIGHVPAVVRPTDKAGREV